MSATLSPVAVSSRKLEAQIRAALRPNETILARADSNRKFPFLMEIIPFFNFALEFVRGRCELVVTNQRLILVHCRRLTHRVKSCQAIALKGVTLLELLDGFTQSSVRFTFADDRKLKFGRINCEVAQQFYDRFPKNDLSQSLEAMIRESVEKAWSKLATESDPVHTSAA